MPSGDVRTGVQAPDAAAGKENDVLRYIVSSLGPNTPQVEQDKLISALKTVKGLKDVGLALDRHEITFGIAGPEPKAKLLEAACASAGFKLGHRM